MYNCFVILDPPTPHDKPPRSLKMSSIHDLHLPIAIVLLTLFVVVLLGFFAYSLTRQETEYETDGAMEFSEKPSVQTASTITFRRGGFVNSQEGTMIVSVQEGKPLNGEKISKNLDPYVNSSKIRVESVTSSSAETLSSWMAAVYSDHRSCSEIGRSILLRGGNAVDAAVSTMLCLSAALPHRGGFGGGLMATIYNNSICSTFNSRETCPSAASESYFLNRRDETVVGPKAVAVPGFLSGLYRAYERFSSKHLTWKQLLMPTVELCVRGINVSEDLSTDVQRFHSMITNDPAMRSLFINQTTRQVLAPGDKMFCPQLAAFLSDISDTENPVEYFYRGEGSARILKAINEEEAFITARDLDDFETEHQLGLQSHISGTTLCGPQPPSLYAIVQLAVNAMQSTNSTASPDIPLLSWDQSTLIADAIFDSGITIDAAKMTTGGAVKSILESLKDGLHPELKWEPSEEGSFSVLIIDENGQAVSIGSSLGDKFGSRQFTNLGFFLNNAMGAFTYGTRPGSVEERNAPQAAKCPRTRMTPMIASRSGVVEFVSGGTDYLRLCMVVADTLLGRKTQNALSSPLLFKNGDGLELKSGDQALLSGY